jgi:hypothetical protein
VDPSGFFPSVAIPGVSFQSRLDGLTHPASFATAPKSPPPLFSRPSSFFLSALSGPPLGVLGVGHPASHAASASELCTPPSFSRFGSFEFFVVFSALGVGHPPKPLSDVRRADARRAQIGTPDGISHLFQVKAYSSEP